jgi:hypothetical protein
VLIVNILCRYDDHGGSSAANDPVDYLFRRQAEGRTNEDTASQAHLTTRPFGGATRDLQPVTGSWRDRPTAGDSSRLGDFSTSWGIFPHLMEFTLIDIDWNMTDVCS